jgi:hypothetical protein
MILSFVALLFASFCASSTFAQSASVTLGVEFGVRQFGGGDCVAKGVCDCQVSGVGIPVTFSIDPDNANVLVMTFSLSDLKNSQPDMTAYFASGSYMFDANFSLSSSMFSALNLQSNPQILTTSNSTVTIVGDVVTDYITYSHN